MRSTRTLPRLVALALVACMGASAAGASAPSEDRLDRLDRRQARVERRLERVNAVGDRLATRISRLDRRRAATEAALADLRDRIAGLDRTIGRLEDRLAEAQRRIAELSERIRVIQGRLERNEELFHARAVSAYKVGPAGAVETLLSSTDLADLIDRFTYYASALAADARLVSQIEALEAEATLRREEVERRHEQIAADKLALQATRSRLDTARDRAADALAARQATIARKKALLAGVRARADRLRGVHDQLARESDRIQALLSFGASGVALPPGGRLAWPAAGALTSGFGYRVHPILGESRMHTGIDIGAPMGAPVFAAASGVVAYVGTLTGYGNVVAVDHGGGLATTYNHLSEFYVATGERVHRGEHIAAVGCTGLCTGPHLHFEVRVNGMPVDPLPYLR